MKSLCQEIIRFIQSISSRERKRNPKIRRKIQSLLKCIDDIPQSDERPKPMDNKKLRSYFNKDII